MFAYITLYLYIFCVSVVSIYIYIKCNSIIDRTSSVPNFTNILPAKPTQVENVSKKAPPDYNEATKQLTKIKQVMSSKAIYIFYNSKVQNPPPPFSPIFYYIFDYD